MCYGAGMRKCPRCRIDKDESEFYGSTTERRCRQCKRELSSRYQRENPDKYRDSQRRTRMKSRYGVTMEQYEAMLAAQGGKCKICGHSESRNPRSPDGWWSVDHDHETGAVRGLLCLRCNSALGWYEDNAEAVSRYIMQEPTGGSHGSTPQAQGG